jgi:hypothetical protein
LLLQRLRRCWLVAPRRQSCGSGMRRHAPVTASSAERPSSLPACNARDSREHMDIMGPDTTDPISTYPPHRVQQYATPRDLLEVWRATCEPYSKQLRRPLLDAAITYCCTAWSLAGWLYAPIYRDPAGAAAARAPYRSQFDGARSRKVRWAPGGALFEPAPCADIAADPGRRRERAETLPSHSPRLNDRRHQARR